MGIDVEKGFQETYEVIESKAKVLAELKAEAKKADVLLLATDPDREGEAIAWHLAEELKRPELEVQARRVPRDHEEGRRARRRHPRDLDQHLYDAQRARRVLDRIVGYDVSALVWSKLAFGLSAGRVQSVALRLIVDREREIEAFVPEEYWNVGVGAARQGAAQAFVGAPRQGRRREARGQERRRRRPRQARPRERASTGSPGVTQREQKRNAPAPYTTSKLQQDATSYLRFATKRTMQHRAGLYEGIDLKKDGGLVGLITYMRTDSVRVSADAIDRGCATFIEETLRRELPAGEAERLQVAEERAGSARGDPPDVARASRPRRCESTSRTSSSSSTS